MLETTAQVKQAFYSDFKRIHRKVILTSIEAILHGTVIMSTVMLALPQVRLSGGRLLPIGALHMSVFFLILLVNQLRYLFRPSINKLNFLAINVISLSAMTLGLIIYALPSQKNAGIVAPILTVMSNYDSCTMIVNTCLFCLAISYFIEEIIKNYIFPTNLKEEYAHESDNKDILNDLKDQEARR
jgi:hypothetical protein